MIAQEAGGIVTGSAEAFAKCNGSFDVTEEILTGRKYLVIRGIADTVVCTVVVFSDRLADALHTGREGH